MGPRSRIQPRQASAFPGRRAHWIWRLAWAPSGDYTPCYTQTNRTSARSNGDREHDGDARASRTRTGERGIRARAASDAFQSALVGCDELRARLGRERVLGPRHPDTLRSVARLAQVYSRLGHYGDARALLGDTAARLERTWPDGDRLMTELRQNPAGIGEE